MSSYKEMLEKQGLVEVRRQHPHILNATVIENVPKEWCVFDGFEWQWRVKPKYREFQPVKQESEEADF